MSGISDDDLHWLLELLEQEGLSEIEVHEGETEVTVSRAVAVAAPPPAAAPLTVACEPAHAAPEVTLPENHLPVLSPMAGVFYTASSPEAAPFAQVGDHVEHGDTVGLVEAMKLFNEVPASASGTVVSFLVESGEAVEADQPLMIIEIPGPH